MKLQTIHISSVKGYISIAAMLVAGTSQLNAQTTPADSILNRTVIVEQQYNPDIRDAQKINVVPQVEEIKVIPRQVEYDSQMFPATSLPQETINAFAGKEEQEKTNKGYARLGYGMYGNLDAKANYLFTLGQKDKLNIGFGMDGRDGKLESRYGTGKWNNHFYRTRAAVNYIHQFGKMDMDIAGDIGLSNFNNLVYDDSFQKKFTSGGGHLGFTSTDSELPVQFKAETNLMLYSRHSGFVGTGSEAFKETMVRTKADVYGNIGEVQKVGVAFGMDNRFYGGFLDEDLTTLLLNPYYAIGGENWNVHLGVNVDLAFGYGDKFNASPDVKAEYIFSDSYILYVKATGGRLSNDFRRLEQFDPFAEMLSFPFEDSYRQLEGTLGLKASPVNGLWFNLFGGYERTRKDLLTTVFNFDNASASDYGTCYYLTNSNNIFAGADLSYNYKNIFTLALHGKYQSWDSGMEYPSLLMPEFTFGGQIGINPIEKLNINLGYEFIQRKQLDGIERLDAVNNLRLGASYEILNGISVYARASNLLNKKYFYYLGYYDQGASFLGGLSFRF